MVDIEKNFKHKEYASLEGMCFKLREIEHIKNQANDWELRLQFIESHMILVAASGQGWLTIDGQFTELRQGSVYVCTPGQLVEAAVHTFDERGFYHMRFDVMDDEGSSVHSMQIIKRNSPFPAKGEVIVTSPVSVNALCDTICQYLQDEDRLKRFRGQILFQELLHTILQDAHLVQENDSETALEYVKGYIEQHFQQELTIDHLAKVAGISTRHFMRLFKKRYGCSAIDYLAVFRIEQAQQLMRSGGQNRLRDIARHVGYHDDIYFRRKFKQVSGVPPAAFMKNSRKKIVAYDFSNIGQLIALQINPCAAPADHPWTDYYKRKYQMDSVLPLSSNQWIKREEIRLAEPDFIIGIDNLVPPEEQDMLREIAPTFFVPWVKNDWRMHLRLIGQFLDKTVEAETWLGKYDRKALFVREQVKHVFKDDSLLILRITGDRYNVLGNRSLGTVFYDDLHVVPVRGVDLLRPDQQVTPDQLADFDPDRLLLIVDEGILSQLSWRTLMNSKLWSDLKAVRNSRVDFLPSYPWVEYTAFTHELMLDEVLKIWRDRA
ncbi:helix-turn-helix domain-containing protein [Paenibacillus sp. IHBB 10380]|uniref:helix-turn-helix domain-containing protein n=1 Tax=Paenibacillus sp. IHBB 10380 TaxID=1566358 RepID=UPI000696CDC1|nr:helix-turn-helix domain-containing protein [Paenibacillus sp. IHBB 10380]